MRNLISRLHPLLILRAILLACVATALPVAATDAPNHGVAEHVVVIVWDGMRPDFVTPRYTPNLYQLASGGVFFTNHHPVFISSTEVNASAIATGLYPNHTGIYANYQYFPDYFPPDHPITAYATEKLEVVRRGDQLTGGRYLGGPTIAEMVQSAGFPTATTGTKAVALFLDRSADRRSGPAAQSINLRQGKTLPPEALAAIEQQVGRSFPTNVTYPNVEQDAWTTDALTRSLWKDGVPKFSMLWMSDPDYTQHRHGPGSPEALAAIASVDRNLGAVLDVLQARGVREKTDVFVLSDHGFSTIGRTTYTAGMLRTNGFNASNKFDKPEPGQVLAFGVGGAVLLYVTHHEPAIIQRLVEFFQSSDPAAVIFTRHRQKGTFSFADARLDASTTLPDLLVAMRWSPALSTNGAPGLIVSDNTGQPGGGAHASLSPYDMHNTLIASGPDLRRNWVDTLPTGNADLAPTVLWILGLTQPQLCDGRILGEALRDGPKKIPTPRTKILRASKKTPDGAWQQSLTITRLGRSVYFDEGTGGSQKGDGLAQYAK